MMNAASFSLFINTLRTSTTAVVALLDQQGNLLGITHSEEAQRTTQGFLSRLPDPHGPDVLQMDGVDGLYLFFPDCVPDSTLSLYAHTLFRLSQRQQESRRQNDVDYSDRLYLIYQLTMLGNSSKESLPLFASRLKYDPNLLRCAILFRTSTEMDYLYYKEGHQFLLQSVASAPGFCREDIYELLSFDQMIVFKAFPDNNAPAAAKADAMRFASAVIKDVESCSNLRITACIGSFYSDISRLHESYKEARFLLYNANLLNDSSQIMLIENHIFEYLFSLLPQEYWQKKFRRFDVLEGQGALSETLLSLSKNNVNLANTAKELNLHRNTINNRYIRLKELLHIDLQNNDRDRLEVRQYALCRQVQTVLHAGTNIQHSSIIHMGFCKFAEFVSDLSGGSLVVDLHVISNSGDNQSLVDILLGGSLDFAALDFNAIAPQSQNRITVFQLPFLFESSEEAFDILDGEFGQSLADSILPSGLVHMGFWSMGWRMFTTNLHPIRRPQDIEGLRIRIMHKNIVSEYMQSLGAKPIKMHYKDIHPALVQRLIDGQENPYGNIMSMKLYTNQNYISEIPMYFDVVNLLSTQTALNRFTPQQREIIFKAAEMTTRWQHSEVGRYNNKYRNELLRLGLKIVPFDESTRPAWLECAKPFYDAFEPHDTLKLLMRAKEAYHAAHHL